MSLTCSEMDASMEIVGIYHATPSGSTEMTPVKAFSEHTKMGCNWGKGGADVRKRHHCFMGLMTCICWKAIADKIAANFASASVLATVESETSCYQVDGRGMNCLALKMFQSFCLVLATPVTPCFLCEVWTLDASRLCCKLGKSPRQVVVYLTQGGSPGAHDP